MTYTLEAFCKDCHTVLKSDKGPSGREKIRDLIEKVLTNKELVAKHLGPDLPRGRKTLYEDPELKFCVLAHVDHGGRSSAPHDHGRSWAVYGQAVGWSEMSMWKRKGGGTDASVLLSWRKWTPSALIQAMPASSISAPSTASSVRTAPARSCASPERISRSCRA